MSLVQAAQETQRRSGQGIAFGGGFCFHSASLPNEVKGS